MPKRTPEEQRLRTLYVRLAVATLPGLALGMACDTYDEYTQVVPVTNAYTAEELTNLCGDVEWSACQAICDAVIAGEGDVANRICYKGDSCNISSCALIPDDSDPQSKPLLETFCECSYIAGRMTEGILDDTHPDAAPADALARWLAQLTWSEAAAVHAFSRLATELEHHGAPAHLIEGCRNAAREEIVHTTLAAELARARGVMPASPTFEPLQLRPLEAIAMENAAEGCVRESFAACLATRQAMAASEPALQRLLARIAEDETGHAALSHALHDWMMTQLTPEGRERVARARREALTEIDDIGSGYGPALREVIGFPSPEGVHALAEAFREAAKTNIS